MYALLTDSGGSVCANPPRLCIRVCNPLASDAGVVQGLAHYVHVDHFAVGGE